MTWQFSEQKENWKIKLGGETDFLEHKQLIMYPGQGEMLPWY